MPSADLVIHNAAQIVTCAFGDKPKRGEEMREVGMLQDGAIAISDKRIVAVGPSPQITRDFSAAELFDAGGRVVCPGFVDPHTHIVYAGNRLDEFELKIRGAEYLDILAAGGGIISTVRHTRSASSEELVAAAITRLDRMLACGTTTAEIKTGYGLDLESELKMLRVIEQLDRKHPIQIVPTFLAAHTVPPEFRHRPNEYVELICKEMMPTAWDWYQESQFAPSVPFFFDVFTERNAFDLDQTEKLMGAAREFGFALKAHVDQFTNLGGSRLAIEMKATSVDHLDAITEAEVALLATGESVGVVIPTENFNGGKTEFADARKMIDTGCAIAVATDFNPGSAPCPSQLMAMAIAARYQKLLPAECLSATTVNAAHAIGLGDRIGSLEPGKQADLVVLEITDYRHMVYEFGGSLVHAVFKAGKRVH